MADRDRTRPLADSALAAGLLRALGRTWDEINQNHFGGKLRRPVLFLDEGTTRLGHWDGERRALGMSRPLVLQQSWATVREVLKHEVAHQFVDEVLGVRDQSAHGPAFVSVCARFGIDAAASGLPAADPQGSPGEPVLRRIGRLLALAGSPNLHEAEAAMRQAQRLMLKYNIEEVAEAATRGYRFRHLGAPLARIDAARQILAGILGDHFFVEVIWVPSYDARTGREGRVLEACGSAANLEVASWVHDYLLETGARLWREHKARERIPGERDRRRFQLGVMMGFRKKLEEGKASNRQEGLVWRGDPALTDYLARRYPRRSSGGRIGYQQDAAYQKGHQAGQGIVLQRVVKDEGTSRGRLLGGYSSRSRA